MREYFPDNMLNKRLVNTYCSNSTPRICIFKHLYAIQLLEREVWKPELNKCLLCFKKNDIILIAAGLKLPIRNKITNHKVAGYKYGKCVICGCSSIVNMDDICACCGDYRKIRQRLSNRLKIVEKIKSPIVSFKRNMSNLNFNYEGFEKELFTSESIPVKTLIDIMEKLEDKILSLLKESKCVNMYQEGT